MYFCIYHREISDWNRFNDLGNELSQAPANLKSLAYFPNRDHKSAICLWYADSLQSLRNYLDQKCSGVCRNDYFEVDEQAARGLPKVAAPA
jgi:hypothetical protein